MHKWHLANSKKIAHNLVEKHRTE